MKYAFSRAAVSGALAIALVSGAVSSAFAGAVVPTQHNDNFRTGANLAETILTPALVRQRGMHRTDRAVDGMINTQILYASGVSVNGKRRNVAYVTTSANSVYAYDADDRTPGLQHGLLWRTPLLDEGASPPTYARGISATPVLEFANGKSTIDVLYSTADHFPPFAVYVKDELALRAALHVHYYLVKLDLATGKPVIARGGAARIDAPQRRRVDDVRPEVGKRRRVAAARPRLPVRVVQRAAERERVAVLRLDAALQRRRSVVRGRVQRRAAFVGLEIENASEPGSDPVDQSADHVLPTVGRTARTVEARTVARRLRARRRRERDGMRRRRRGNLARRRGARRRPRRQRLRHDRQRALRTARGIVRRQRRAAAQQTRRRHDGGGLRRRRLVGAARRAGR